MCSSAGPKPEGPELVQETFRATNPPGDFQTAWSRILARWICAARLAEGSSAGFQRRTRRASCSANLGADAASDDAESPEIVFVRSYAIDDGRYVNNGWLQEMPDPITKLTWDNAALMSPNFAKNMSVETGDLIQISDDRNGAGCQGISRSGVSW